MNITYFDWDRMEVCTQLEVGSCVWIPVNIHTLMQPYVDMVDHMGVFYEQIDTVAGKL